MEQDMRTYFDARECIILLLLLPSFPPLLSLSPPVLDLLSAKWQKESEDRREAENGKRVSSKKHGNSTILSPSHSVCLSANEASEQKGISPPPLAHSLLTSLVCLAVATRTLSLPLGCRVGDK